MSEWNQRKKKDWYYPDILLFFLRMKQHPKKSIESDAGCGGITPALSIRHPKPSEQIPHCAEVPVPVFTSLPDLTAHEMLLEVMDDTDSSDSSVSCSSSMAAAASSLSAKPKLFSQDQLNDFVCDLGLSKESSEILSSRLGEHGILDSGIKVTFYHDRDDLLIRFLTMEDFKASFQKWVVKSTTQMNGDCL